MTNLLSLKFWFNFNYVPFQPLTWKILLIFVGLLIIGTIILAFFRKRPSAFKLTLIKLFNFSLTNALIGALLLFFNYEMALFFSARVFWLFWFVGMFIWLIFIFKEFRKIPARKKEIAAEKAFNKYLPK